MSAFGGKADIGKVSTRCAKGLTKKQENDEDED